MASTVFLITCAQAILLALLIIVLIAIWRKGQPLIFALLILGALLISCVLDLFFIQALDVPAFVMVQLALSLLYAASTYLFARSLYEKIRFRSWWMHYLAVVLCLVQVVYFAVFSAAPYQGAVFRLEILLIVAVLFYYGIQFFMFVQYLGRQHPGAASNTYLRQFALLYLIYHTAQLIVALAFSDAKADSIATLSTIAALLALVYLAYLLINIALLERQKQQESSSKVIANPAPATDLKLEEIFQHLHQRMHNDQLYLDPGFSLEKLSRLEQINSKYLSQAINTCYGENFSKYINHFRLEAFKERAQLQDLRHLSLLSIALDCGFSSKSTFNRAFKEYEGCSPSEWLKNMSPAN